MKVSDYVMNFLESKGVKHVFFLPGGGCMHLLDSLGNKDNVNKVVMLHEQAVAIAAENYAMVTGEVGVGLVTTGPGGTNTVTGVAAAYIDSTPVVFISGQAKTQDLKSKYNVRQLGNQEVDIVSIVKPITKYAVTVLKKEEIRYHLEKAWMEATTGRKGPVWIDIPLDIQGASIEESELKGYDHSIKEEEISHDVLNGIIEDINNSKRPLIIAGNGIRLAGAVKEAEILLEYLNIPVIPTWKAMDLVDNENKLFVGKCGALGDRTANFALQNADLIISLASKLDYSITGYNTSEFGRNAKKIMIDIDQCELNKLDKIINVKIRYDIKEFIELLLQSKQQFIKKEYSEWKNRIQVWKNKYPIIQPKHYERCTTYSFIDTLCKTLPNNAVIVPCSAGTTAEIFFQAFNVKRGQKIRSNHGLGSMGFDIPASIGACYANDRNSVICVTGDGGMQLNIQELATIAGNKLPIKIFVIDNSGYCSIRNMQNTHFSSRYIGNNAESGLNLPDIHNIANAYGIKYEEVSNNSEMEEKISRVIEDKEPVICKIAVDTECVVEPKLASKVMPDGSMKSMPLEDMYPFLSEEEIKENMGNI